VSDGCWRASEFVPREHRAITSRTLISLGEEPKKSDIARGGFLRFVLNSDTFCG